MKPDERARLVFVVVNALAAIAIVILQDPELRRELAAQATQVAGRARQVYARAAHRPDPVDVSAVISRAEQITREGAS